MTSPRSFIPNRKIKMDRKKLKENLEKKSKNRKWMDRTNKVKTRDR